MRIVIIILVSLFALNLQAADLSALLLTDEWSIRSDLMVGRPVPVQFVSKLARDQLAKTPTWQEGLDYKSVQRYDYPGLGNTNYSTMYAFPWETQLHLEQKQGWTIDTITFTTNKLAICAVIRLQRLEKLKKKSPANTALGPMPAAP